MSVYSTVLSLGVVALGSTIPESAHLSWQLDHSSDVALARVVGATPVALDGKTCGLVSWKFEVLEGFKGELSRGDTVEVWGPNDPRYWAEGSKRLLFMRQYEYGQGEYDACHEHLFSSYRQVHWGCCEVRGSGDQAEVLFGTMLNSETSGSPVPVRASVVYEALRAGE